MLNQARCSQRFVQPLCARPRVSGLHVVARAGADREGTGNNVSGEYCSLGEDGKKVEGRSLMEKETDFLDVCLFLCVSVDLMVCPIQL